MGNKQSEYIPAKDAMPTKQLPSKSKITIEIDLCSGLGVKQDILDKIHEIMHFKDIDPEMMPKCSHIFICGLSEYTAAFGDMEWIISRAYPLINITIFREIAGSNSINCKEYLKSLGPLTHIQLVSLIGYIELLQWNHILIMARNERQVMIKNIIDNDTDIPDVMGKLIVSFI